MNTYKKSIIYILKSFNVLHFTTLQTEKNKIFFSYCKFKDLFTQLIMELTAISDKIEVNFDSENIYLTKI